MPSSRQPDTRPARRLTPVSAVRRRLRHGRFARSTFRTCSPRSALGARCQSLDLTVVADLRRDASDRPNTLLRPLGGTGLRHQATVISPSNTWSIGDLLSRPPVVGSVARLAFGDIPATDGSARHLCVPPRGNTPCVSKPWGISSLSAWSSRDLLSRTPRWRVSHNSHPVPQWISISAGMAAFVLAVVFLMPRSCLDVGGVSSWERCTSAMGTPALSRTGARLRSQLPHPRSLRSRGGGRDGVVPKAGAQLSLTAVSLSFDCCSHGT